MQNYRDVDPNAMVVWVIGYNEYLSDGIYKIIVGRAGERDVQFKAAGEDWYSTAVECWLLNSEGIAETRLEL